MQNNTIQMMLKRTRLLQGLLSLTMAAILGTPLYSQRLDDSWRVTVAGQTVQVNPDGSFLIPNITAPDEQGNQCSGQGSGCGDFKSDDFMRLLGERSVNGVPEYVFSEPFQLFNGTFRVGRLTFGSTPFPDTNRLRIEAGTDQILVGETVQLSATATLGDGTERDVTTQADYTTYRVSDPRKAQIDPQTGILTATARGSLLVTVTNLGVTATKRLIITSNDSIEYTLVGFVNLPTGGRAGGVEISSPFGAPVLTNPDGFFTLTVTVPNNATQITLSMNVDSAGASYQASSVVDLLATDLILDVGVVTLVPILDSNTPLFPGQFFPVSNNPFSVTAADFDGDGLIDLATANVNSGNVSILLADSQIRFLAAQNFAVGEWPRSVASTDFNGDGHIDLATANFDSDDVSLLLANGQGGFLTAQNYAAGNGPNSVKSADFNNDGFSDLVVANSFSDNVSILLGDGQGGFSTAQNFGVGDAPSAVTTADFNSDGFIDLATSNTNSRSVSILLGNGQGGVLTTLNFALGSGPFFITAADFNSDGFIDLATPMAFDSNVRVLLGNGQGGFLTTQNYPVGGSPLFVTSADFNSDGLIDLATCNAGSSDVSILLADGQGGFLTAQSFAAGDGPVSAVPIDSNNDGFIDLAIADASQGHVFLLLGDGQGEFQEWTAPQSFNVCLSPFSVTTSDFNGDGLIDLATANPTCNNVSVRLGDGQGGFLAEQNFAVADDPAFPTEVTTADLNNDGIIDLVTANQEWGDVSIMLGDGQGGFFPAQELPLNMGELSVTTADFNGDGIVDLATANYFLDNVSILLGDGQGGFLAGQNFAVGVAPTSVTAADFDGDGLIDLATANYFSDDVSILLGESTGGFLAAQSYAAGNGPTSLKSADINNDGFIDLVTANENSRNISILLGDGQGGILPAQDLDHSNNGNVSVTTADFDGDGIIDLATANFSTSNFSIGYVSIFLGDGQGGFLTEQQFHVGIDPRSVTTADFNGDGLIDLLTANRQGGGNVSVLLNQQ